MPAKPAWKIPPSVRAPTRLSRGKLRAKERLHPTPKPPVRTLQDRALEIHQNARESHKIVPGDDADRGKDWRRANLLGRSPRTLSIHIPRNPQYTKRYRPTTQIHCVRTLE